MRVNIPVLSPALRGLKGLISPLPVTDGHGASAQGNIISGTKPVTFTSNISTGFWPGVARTLGGLRQSLVKKDLVPLGLAALGASLLAGCDANLQKEIKVLLTVALVSAAIMTLLALMMPRPRESNDDMIGLYKLLSNGVKSKFPDKSFKIGTTTTDTAVIACRDTLSETQVEELKKLVRQIKDNAKLDFPVLLSWNRRVLKLD